MRVLFFYFILFSSSTLFCYHNNRELLEEMFNYNDWDVENRHSDSLTVFKKKLEGVNIPAFKATMISSIPMEYIMEAIADGENHEEFMGSSHVVESEFIGDSNIDTTYSYQMLDLPIVSDRHYITTNFNDTVSVNHYRMNWMIDNRKNLRDFKQFIDKKNEIHKNPIFIDDGVGSWELRRLNNGKTQVSYYVLINPGGWIPNRLISYVNKSLGPDTVIMMVKEGGRRYKLEDSSRYVFFSLAEATPDLVIERLKGKLVIRNNLDIQIMINMYNVKSVEKWSIMNSIQENSNNTMSIARTYRIDLGPNRSEEIAELVNKLRDLSVIKMAETRL